MILSRIAQRQPIRLASSNPSCLTVFPAESALPTPLSPAFARLSAEALPIREALHANRRSSPSCHSLSLRALALAAFVVSLLGLNSCPAQAQLLSTTGSSSVCISEILAENLSKSLLDAAGEPDPWIELYNNSSNTISLTDCFLSTNPARPAQWRFPSGASLPGFSFMIVWADGQPDQSSKSPALLEYHTNFKLDPGSGSVVLSGLANGQTQVMDYITYSNLPPDRSVGKLRYAPLAPKVLLPYPTPGKPNPAPKSVLLINEWLPRPAANDGRGWFEQIGRAHV